MTRKVFYNYSTTGCKNIDTFIYLSESLGFRHKFLIVQKLPKAVTIDWAQVLRIIKDIRDIVIQPSISGNHIKAESLSIRLITLLPVRPLVHLIFYHYWNSFFLGHSQFTNSCNYFQAPPAFHLFGAALCIPAVYSTFQMASRPLQQSLGQLKQSWPYKPLVDFLCQISHHMVNSYCWSLLLVATGSGLSHIQHTDLFGCFPQFEQMENCCYTEQS